MQERSTSHEAGHAYRRPPAPQAQRAARAVCATLFFFCLCGALGAQAADTRILGRDDLDFAHALSRAGYPDLAEQVLNAIEGTKGGGGGDDSLSASALRFDFDKAEAYRESDPLVRVQLLGKLVLDMESFVQSHPGSVVAEGVQDGLLDLYRAVGEQIAVLLQDPANAAEATKLRELGTAMFDRGLKVLETRIESLSAQREEHAAANPDLPNEDLDRQYMLASYSLARTRYFKGLLFEKFAKAVILKEALSTLADIQLDFPDQLLCYETYIYEGLCRAELEEPAEAVIAFDYAIGLRDRFETNGGMYQVSPEAADIISSAVLQKMLILSKTGDHAGAVAAARDFYTTIPAAMEALKGLAILAQEAEEYRTLGDNKAFEETARKLIELDPRGPAGQRGRELLGGGGGATSLSAVDMLRLAETAAGQGEVQRAIELCQEVMILARGVTTEADLGSQAGLLLGALFARDNALHEAAVAWDTASERYSKGKEAPECLWRAVNAYIALKGQERLDFYQTRAREGMNTLVARYPEHPRASGAALLEGQRLESEQDFAGAAKIFESIQPGTPSYEEAIYKAGGAWSRQARKLLLEGQAGPAKEAVTKSETLLKKARTELETAAGQTLDTAAQERLKTLAFNARVTLANLYLVGGVDRPADVTTTLDGAEQLFPGDKQRLSTVRILRTRALLDQDKIDPAISLLDQQVADDPSAKGIGPCAAQVAQALDAQAAALRESDSSRSEFLTRRATDYYLLAIKRQIGGDGTMKPEDLEAVANRLFSFALYFNGVPEDVNTFVGWKGARTAADLLEQAARTYEDILPSTSSTKVQINLARALGFLGQWTLAAARYDELFARERMADLAAKTLNPDVLRRKPELILAFLEWGVCLREVGVSKFDKARLEQASAVFEILVINTEEEGKLWWQSKYYQLQTLSDRGEYEVADIAMRSLERNWPEFDQDQFDLKDKFVAMRDELKQKVPK